MTTTDEIPHDRLFKGLLDIFLPDYIRLFYRDFYSCIDFSKEVLPLKSDTDSQLHIMLDTTPRYIDRGYGVTAKDGNKLVLHFEAQSYNQTIFSQRMHNYYCSLRSLYEDREVHPFAICFYNYTQKNKDNTYTPLQRPGVVTNQFEYNKTVLNALEWDDAIHLNEPLFLALSPLLKRKKPYKDQYKFILHILEEVNDKYNQLGDNKITCILNFISEYFKPTDQEVKDLVKRLTVTKGGGTTVSEIKDKLEDKGQTRMARTIVIGIAEAKFKNMPEEMKRVIISIDDADKLNRLAVSMATLDDITGVELELKKIV